MSCNNYEAADNHIDVIAMELEHFYRPVQLVLTVLSKTIAINAVLPVADTSRLQYPGVDGMADLDAIVHEIEVWWTENLIDARQFDVPDYAEDRQYFGTVLEPLGIAMSGKADENLPNYATMVVVELEYVHD